MTCSEFKSAVDTLITVTSGLALVSCGYVIGYTRATQKAVAMVRETCRKVGAGVPR